MNTWNQWGAAPGAATVAAGYQNAAAAAAGANPGMAGASAGMVFPGAANPAATNAAAAAALTPYAAMGAYGYYGNAAMPPGYGAQWPGAAAAPGAGAGGVGPVAGGAAAQWQQTQWEQWQQQYAQWQQQYGAKMPGMPPTQPQPVSSAPSATDQNQAVSAPSSDTTLTTGEKRPASDTPSNESKKSKTGDGKKETLEELIEAEKAFDVQFKNWESQFEKWKEQNINHPDKTQYKEYEAKWESWREQLVQRRDQMRKKRETRLEEIKQEKAAQEAAAKAAASATNPATNAAAAAAAVVAAAAAAAASTAPPDPYGYAAQMPPPPPMFAPYAPYPAAAMFGAPPPPAPAPPAPAPPTNMFNPMSLPPPPVVNAAADKDKAMNQDKGSPFGGQGMRPKDGKGIPGLDLLADGAKHFKDNNKPPPSFNPYGENKNQPMITTSDDCKAFDFPKSKPDNQSDFFKNFNVPPPPSAGGFGGNMIPGLMEGFNPGQFPPNFNKDDQSGERHKQSRFSGSNNEGSSSNQGPEGQWTPGKDQLKTGGSRWGNNDLPPDESSSFSRGSLEDKGSRDRFGRDDSNDRFGDNSPFSRGGGDRFSGSRDSFGRKGPGDGLLEKPFGFGGRPGVNLDEPDRFGGSPADRFGGPEGDRFGPGGDRFGGGPDDRARGGPGGGRFGAPDDRFGGEPRGPPEDRFGNRFGGDRQQPGDRFGGPPRPRDRFGGGDDSQGFEGSQGDKPDDELSGDGSRGRGGRFGGPPEGDRFGGDAPGFRDGPGFRGGDRFGRQRGGRFGGPPGGDRFEPPEGDRFGGSPRKGLLDTPERFGPGDGPKFEGGFRGGPGGNRFGRDNRFGPGPDGPEGFRDEPLRMGPETDAGDASQPGPEGHDSFEGPPAGPNKGPVSLLDLPPIKPPFVPEGPRGGDGILGPAPDDVGRFNSPRNDDRFPPGTPGSNSARSPWMGGGFDNRPSSSSRGRNWGPEPSPRGGGGGFRGRGDRGRFGGGRDDFRADRDDRFRGEDDFRGERDHFRGERDDFRGGDHFRGGRDDFRGERDHLRGERDHFRGDRDDFRGERDHFRGGDRDDFRGERDHFRGGGGFRGRGGFRGDRDGRVGRGERGGFRGGHFRDRGDRGGPRDRDRDWGGRDRERDRSAGRSRFEGRRRNDERDRNGGGGGGGGEGGDNSSNEKPDNKNNENEPKEETVKEVAQPQNTDEKTDTGPKEANTAEAKENQKGGPDKSTPHESEEQEQYRPSTVHDYSVESDADRPGVKVIDYKHSKLEPSYDEPETLEPLKMFDYDHGSKRMNYLKYEAGERGFRISDDFGRNVDSNGYRGRDRDRNRDGSRDRDRDRDRNRDRDRPRSRDRDRNRDSGRGDRDRDVGRGDRDRDSARGDRDRDRDSARGDRDRDRERDRDANRDKDRGTPRRRSRSRERGNRDSAPERDEKRKQHPDDDNNKEDTKENEKNKSSSVQSSNSQSAEKRNRGSTGPKPRAVLIEDLLTQPNRVSRPPKILIILRGPPGSGKTYVAKLIKDKEVEEKGTAPRILSIDDYFIAETEKTEVDPDTGRKVTKRVLEYEYEAVMEPNYRTSLLRALKKTVSDGYFPFIIVDSVNDKIDHYEEMYNFAIQNGFQVYITEMDMDASACSKRNIHKRTEKEIQDVIDGWEPMPNYQVELDIRSLLQSAAITEVDMEDCCDMDVENSNDTADGKGGENKGEEKKNGDSEEDGKGEDVTTQGLFRSKWDNVDCTGEKLDKLDGLVKARKSDSSIKDWLQLPDDYYDNPSRPSKPGAKRDTGDFFWIDPNQSFLTTVPIKSQAPKVPIVCDLDKEMTAFEESIGVTESHVSGEHSSPGNDSGFRDSKKTCADNIQVGNKTHSERKLPDVDNKMPDIDKKMPDVDKEMSDVDNKMPDIDKKMPDVDKKMSDVDKKMPDVDKKIPDGDKKISVSDKMSDVDKEDQIVQLGKLKKTDVHKMIAANLEKEDKELENLNKNLMGIIGNLMAKVQSVPTAASDGSSLALDPRNSSLASDISINPSMDPKESIPQSIDVLESSAVGPCPTAGYDDLHLLDPQDRPHYNVETGILQPQFNEHVIPIGDTPSFPQYPQQYYSQYPGQSHVASSDQQSFVPHGNVPIYPYSDHGSAVVDLYPGQYMYDVQPSGYDDDHSPGQYSDSEEPNSAPHVGPCTPEQQPSVEASKKPFMTDEEIRLHRKEYFRKKREEQLMKASLLGNPDHALQPSSTVSKQHHTDPRLSKPDHSRKDQKPTPSKLNQPKGTNSRYQNEPSQNTKFMIPKRNEKAQEGRQFEINPTNPFAPNPKFFMKKKSIAPSSSERNKPDTNKLDKHFYNELKSKFEFKSKSRPVCDNSISSTTDSPTKKKHLSSKFKEIRKDKKYPKNPLDSRKHEAKRKEVSSATLARRIASSDEEDPVENRNKSDNHKLLSDGAKLSLSSKSSFSHLKDTTNAIETYPFVTDAVSRKAMACKCFVKLVNIFWNEKKPITVDEMDEKLPTLVRKKLHLLRKNDSLRAIQGTKNNHEESCSVPESSCPNSSLEKENEKVIDNKQNQEHFEQRTADVAEELLSHEDKGAAQEHGMDMADTIENQQGRSVGDDSEDNEQILTEAKVKLKTSLEGQQEKSAKQMSNSTSEENPEGCRISENDKKGDIDHNSDIQISENKIEENANQTQVVDGNITIKKKPMEDLEDVPVESNTIDTPQEQKGKIPDAIEETPLKRKLIDPEDEVLVQSKKIKGTISDVSDSTSKSKIESRKTRNESQDESIKDMQHEKKRKLNDSLESAKERKTSTESKIDSSTEAREKSTREDTIDTPIESDGESIGCGAGDFSMDHDDSSDNEEIVPHLSHHDTDLEKSDKIETLNETEDLDEFSKLLVKSSETKPGKCEDQKKADGEILEKEKDTFQECRISENDEKGDIDHNSDIQISEIKIEENAEHHKKNPISSDKSSDSSTLNANELVCSKNRITYPDELSCRKCSVKLVDIFWKEKKSMIHEELEEILPTLINDMVKRYKISRKQKKLEMKHERLLEKKSDKKKKKESDSRTLITKGQKKYFRDEGEEAHSKKSKGQKKTLQEESIENLKKKSGISRELVSSSSSDSDDDFKIKKSMDSDKVSTSRDVEQNSDDDTLLNTYKDHSKNKDKSVEHRKKKKRKKISKEKSRSPSGNRTDSENEHPLLDKTAEIDNSLDNQHVSPKSKKERKAERKEKRRKKKEERRERKKKHSKKRKALSSSPNTDNEDEVENTEKHDIDTDNSHIATESEEKSTLESRTSKNVKHGKKQKDFSSSSHSKEKKKKRKSEKSDHSPKKVKVSSSNQNSDNEDPDLLLRDKHEPSKHGSSSIIKNVDNAETSENIVENVIPSIEENTQIFSDSEDECTKTEPFPMLSTIPAEDRHSDSIKYTVSNIINSLSVDCPLKEDKLGETDESEDQELKNEDPLKTYSQSIHEVASCAAITGLSDLSQSGDSCSKKPKNLLPSHSNDEDKATQDAQIKSLEAEKCLTVEENEVSSSMTEDPSQVQKLPKVAEPSDEPCGDVKQSSAPCNSLSPSSGDREISSPEVSTHLEEDGKSSRCAEIVEPSTEDPQLPFQSDNGNQSVSVLPTKVTDVDESCDASTVTQDTLSTSLTSIEDVTKMKDPSHSTSNDGVSVPDSDDQILLSKNTPASCANIVEVENETKDEALSKVQSLHSESSTNNVLTSPLQLDEKCPLGNPVEVRRAPEGMQKDLAELDKKMEEIEKIVCNQLEPAPSRLSTEEQSTKETETDLASCFNCILCKNTFSTEPTVESYSGKVTSFCKSCYENLFKERFDAWRKSLEQQ